MILDVSTTATMETSTAITVAETTTTMLAETTTTVAVEEPTTTLAETTTTVAAEDSTTTLAETTTTTAAETTTTTSSPEPSFYAQYSDGSEVGVYLQSSGFIGTTEDDSLQATFALEADTSRLYLTLPDGSKLYAYTVIPTGPNYGFLFQDYDSISRNPITYHFITCVPDSENLLTCSSEDGPTRIYWYLPDDSPNFYGNMYPEVASYPGYKGAQFRLPGGLEP